MNLTTAMQWALRRALFRSAKFVDGDPPKWCSYCQKSDHNDAECWCTRPANWESVTETVANRYPGGPVVFK